MSYVLLERRNPNGEHFYRHRRRCQHGRTVWHLGVVHSTEQDVDLEGVDGGAEAVSGYAATTPRKVSWHASVDSDSTLELLPPTFTAWHVRGYNRCGLGVEQSYRAHTWAKLPAGWRAGTLDQAARYFARRIAGHPDRTRFRLDRPLTLAEADRGLFGLVAHATLDPGRRSDPGAAYDWPGLLTRIRAHLTGRISTPPPKEDHVQYVRIDGDGRMFAFTGGAELVAVDYATFKAGGELLLGREPFETDVRRVGADHWLAKLPRRNP